MLKMLLQNEDVKPYGQDVYYSRGEQFDHLWSYFKACLKAHQAHQDLPNGRAWDRIVLPGKALQLEPAHQAFRAQRAPARLL